MEATATTNPSRGLSAKARVEFESKEFLTLRQGVYADVLFALLPFLAILVQRLWSGELEKLLLGPELSIATAIVSGLCISKFTRGLLSPPDFGVHKERVVFAIAATLFALLIPATILAIKLSGTGHIPGVIAYLQPLLLVVSVSLYISALSIMRGTEVEDGEADSGTDDSLLEDDNFPVETLLKASNEEKT